MLSPLMLVIIFLEISVVGVTLVGGYALFRKYLQEEDRKCLYMSAIFLAGAISDGGAFVSQILYNLGSPLAPWGYKTLLFCTTIIAVLGWFYIAELFKLRSKLVTLVLTSVVIFSIYIVYFSPIGLTYQGGIIIPLIPGFAILTPMSLFMALTLIGGLSTLGIIGKIPKEMDKRALKIFGIACAFGVGIFISAYIYVLTKYVGFFILAWAFVLGSTTSLFLGHIIPPGSPLLEKPFNYFRSRMIYKLTILFVAIIIVTLASVSLVMINSSNKALSASIIDNYVYMTQGIAHQIAPYAKNPTPANRGIMRSMILNTRIGRKGIVYVIDEEDKVFIHPDSGREGGKIKGIPYQILGGGEFDTTQGRVVRTYSRVEGTTLGVMVEEPVAEAYFEIRKMETYFLLFVILGIVLASLGATWFVRSIEKPIDKLIAGTKIIRGGNLDARVKVETIDETGELAEAFNKMTTDLKESQERLIRTEKLSALGTMSAGMAHEIKNALVPLKTLLDVLQKGGDEDFKKSLIQMASPEINRVDKIARDLLQFSRPQKPHFENIYLNEVIERSIGLLEMAAKKHKVHLIKQLGSLPKMHADSDAIEQVLMNLILNAIEAMSQGGEILIESRAGTSDKLKAPAVFIKIYDTGRGIPEEALKKLFVPFFTTKEGGTGMGLAVVHRIIEDHKGIIEFESEVGKGTTVTIILPQRHEVS